MKKYEKPELIMANFKLSKKPICAQSLASTTEGVGTTGGIFKPVFKNAIYKEK